MESKKYPADREASRPREMIESLESRWMLAFAHPGILNTDADYARMRSEIAAGAQPWVAGYNALAADGYSQVGSSPRPLATVIRGGTGQNFNQMVIDMQRTYQLAVRWKVSNNVAYADEAVKYLNAWSYNMTTLTGNADRFLASGLYGFGWAAAADIVRSYSGWAAADMTHFQDYLVGIYYPMQHDFLVHHNGAAITNYWANWDLANIEGMMAVGIFSDRQDLYDEAVSYLYNGGGNGALDKAFYYRHPGNLFQWQESGRDQGHTVLGMQLFGHIAQTAWNQGLDLYSYNNNAFLAAAEYVAKYNLGYDVPYQTYNWGTGQSGTFASQPGISGASRGDLDVGFELIYGHYAEMLGMAAPYTKMRIDARGTEWRGSGDEFGFGTLTYRQEPINSPQAPRGLTAVERGSGNVELDWFGGVNDTSYKIYRSTTLAGTYTLIASGISDLLTYTDRNLPTGVYYYKVTGVSGATETAASSVASASSYNLLIGQLPFNESSGTSASDSTGNGQTGTLNGGASWTTGKSGNAVLLNGSTGYVSFASNPTEGLSDFTIAAWVNLTSNSTWARIFDFGDSRGRWMYLTPKNGNGVPEFATSTVYGYNKEWVVGNAAFPTGQWVHVALTLADRVGTLFINGIAVGSNANVDFPPNEIWRTTNNWLGRSQFGSDPYLNGKIDDFRVYRGALRAGEVYTLATGTAAPSVPAAPATVAATAVVGNQINLTWSSVSGATGYTLLRSTTSGGPYTALTTLFTGTAYSDTGRIAGVTYYYIVKATNNGGDSAASIQASATALPPLPSAPSGLVAKAISSSAITLTWNDAANAATYSIKRSLVSGGPYTTIATGISTTAYTDTGRTAGVTYYYVITSVNASGESAVSNEDNASPSDLFLHLKLDELSGTLASDSSGNGLDGTALNGTTWSPGQDLGSAQFDGSNDYINEPTGLVNTLTTMTLSTWVKWNGGNAWQRIFDFGSGTGVYMFLTPSTGSVTRFAIRTASVGEQQISGSAALPISAWTHVAVVLNGSVGTLWVNGVLVGSNTSMTLNPSSLGATTQNWIGRSQFSADAYFSGQIDDFRVYNRVLTNTEIQTLANLISPAAPTGLSTKTGDGELALGWSASFGATSYTIARSTSATGPFTTIATRVTSTNYVDSDLANDIPYYYVVYAVRTTRQSPASTVLSGTPVSSTAIPTIVQEVTTPGTEISGTSLNLHALGDDPTGASNLSYTWMVDGTAPGPVTFSVNRNNNAANTTATFTRPGNYTFVVQIANGAGYFVASSITVFVAATQFDGGFEYPSQGTGYAYAPTGSQWVFTNNAGIAADGSAFSVGTGHGGTQTGLLQSLNSTLPSLSQVVEFYYPGTYAIAFLAGQRIYANNAQGLSVLVDGTSIYSVTPTTTKFASFTTPTFVIATAGAHTLTFAGTATSGDQTAFIDDVQIDYVPVAPAVATPAAAAPATVTGTTTDLTVLGSDDLSESNLVYSWSAAGPANVAFTSNGYNISKNTTALFIKAGTYILTATISDGQLTVSSNVTVTVNARLSALSVSPEGAVLNSGQIQQYAATAYDQFGEMMATPALIWSVTGVGSMSAAGVYTASLAGSASIFATSGTISGNAGATVVSSAPTVAAPASAGQTTVTGKSTTLTVLGADDGGEASLVYSWSVATGPSSVVFQSSGTNASKNTTVTFSKAGTYLLRATMTDASGSSVISDVSITVLQTATALTVTPTNVSLGTSQTRQFAASAIDQFGQAIASPAVSWSLSSGAGTVSSSGLYTAPATTGTTVVQAVLGTLSATSKLTIFAWSPYSLTARKASSNTIAITFRDSTTIESGFQLQVGTRLSNGTINWTTIYTLGAASGSGSTVNYTVPSTFAAATWYFRVRAASGASYSNWSNTASVKL